MSKNKKIAQIALAGVVALGLSAAAQTSVAAPNPDYVKCYGVAAAGKNDCGTAISACGASIKQDRACYAWIYAPKGVCEKLAGAAVGAPAKDCQTPKS